MSMVTDLTGAKIITGPQAWQVLQRDADGFASVTLHGTWMAEASSVVEVRVADENTNGPVQGCDWQDAEMLPENGWQLTLRIPTGGLYRIETRMRMSTTLDGWRFTGDKIWHLAVGDLWIIAGQSNAVGYGHGVVSDPPVLGVSVFGGNELWRLATHPIFDTTDTKYPLNRDSGWVDVSPWLAFGKEILRQAGVPVGFIPAALGGSPLSRWDTGNPDGADLFDNMVNMVTAAGGHVAGMVWYQGCSDTCEEAAASYLERFTRFVNAVRERYGADLPIITAQLNRVIDPKQSNLYWSVIREAQRQAARILPHVAVVPTLDLGLSDAIHNNAVANVALGERFARIALGMVYGQDNASSVADVSEVRFLGTTHTSLHIVFSRCIDAYAHLQAYEQDFCVEDAGGMIPITAAHLDGRDTVVLELARAATGETVCHHGYGCNPENRLRDSLLRPPLACYGMKVQEA